MGTGIAEDVLLKALGGASALGVVVYLVITAMKAFGAYLDKQAAASMEKDKLFTTALDKIGADMKSVSGEMKQAIESVKSTIVEIDRAHTANNNQTFQLLISLNDKQGNVIGIVISKVDHLESSVKLLADKQDEHGEKLDLITRSMPGISMEAATARAAERHADRLADRAMDRQGDRQAGQIEKAAPVG
jgi:hypothetical protein